MNASGSIPYAGQVCARKREEPSLAHDMDGAMSNLQQTVFILHGDPQVRDAIGELVRTLGMCALTFGSAAAFHAFEMPDLPACLILDIELPDGNGLEIQKAMGGDGPAMIFLTRLADVRHSVRAIKAGAIDFLGIPFIPEQLTRAIRAAIEFDEWAHAERRRVNDLRRRVARLTRRELQVLSLVVSGMPNKRVATELGISEITVQVHRGRVMQKMEAGSFAELVRDAGVLRIPLSVERQVRRSLDVRVGAQGLAI
jgi:FixJ family two-component response regulator